jgi:hypothetical protein
MSASETVAPPVIGTGTIETVSSSVVSTDPPTIDVFEAPVTETASLIATMSSVSAPALQTQTVSLPRVSTEGQPDSSESKEDTSQFVITSTLLGTQHDCFCSPVGFLVLFLAFDAKGGERVDLGGVLIEGFIFFLCVLHSCIMFTFSPCIV